MLLNADDLGYVEDVSLSNLKLLIGFASVGASAVSHVYPATFPKNWWVLLICCAAYFIGSGILQVPSARPCPRQTHTSPLAPLPHPHGAATVGAAAALLC